jgi:hypothetical protein
LTMTKMLREPIPSSGTTYEAGSAGSGFLGEAEQY